MGSSFFVECPRCARGAEVAASTAGMQATCRECGTTFRIQPLAPAPASDPRPECDHPAGKPSTGRGFYDGLSEPAKLAIDRLCEFREYHLKQDADTRVNTAWRKRDCDTWFDLRGPLGTVATVVGEREGAAGELMRNLGRHRNRELYLLDRYSTRVLLELEWSKSGLEVRKPPAGPRVGRVENLSASILRDYVLRDGEDEPFARVVSPILKPWTYNIRNPDSDELLGVLRRRWTGWGKEYFSDGDDLAIDFADHDWTPEERCVVLAAAIAIDLDSIESRRQVALQAAR